MQEHWSIEQYKEYQKKDNKKSKYGGKKMRCIDCDYRATCGKANREETCDRYKHTPGVVTNLSDDEECCFRASN